MQFGRRPLIPYSRRSEDDSRPPEKTANCSRIRGRSSTVSGLVVTVREVPSGGDTSGCWGPGNWQPATSQSTRARPSISFNRPWVMLEASPKQKRGRALLHPCASARLQQRTAAVAHDGWQRLSPPLLALLSLRDTELLHDAAQELDGEREDDGRGLSLGNLRQGLQVAQLEGTWLLGHNAGRLGQRL